MRRTDHDVGRQWSTFRMAVILALAVTLPSALARPLIAQADSSKGSNGKPSTAPANTASKDPVKVPPKDTTKTPTQTTTMTPAVLPEITNVKVTGVTSAHMRDTMEVPAGMGDVITVHVQGLAKLVARSKCQTLGEAPVSPCTPTKIALYLDRREIKELYPESGAPDVEKGTLTFHLQRSLKSDEAWADLLGGPQVGEKFFRRPTELSVGYENGVALPTDVKGERFQFVRIRRWWFWGAAGALALLIAAMVRLAKRTNLLRDPGQSLRAAIPGAAPGIAGADPNTAHLKPYSLAKCQMAFWFVLTIGSFAFIYIITGASDTVTSSVLALIGISAATFLGASVIDAAPTSATPTVVDTKVKQLVGDLATLETQRAAARQQADTLAQQAANAQPGPARIALDQARDQAEAAHAAFVTEQEEVRRKLDAYPAVVAPHATRHFLTDVLGDGDGPSFHRFQMFVWTIVLGVLFIVGVWSRLAMPEFSGTLLGLMGISSGTYLGFKFPDAKT